MSALLFFDIDGTLLPIDDTHIMPDGTKEALRKAKENGHKIFINTGRVKTAVDKQLLNFGFDGIVCGCGTYVEYEGKTICHHTLTKEACISYAESLRKYRLQTIFEGKDRIFIEGDCVPGSTLQYIHDSFLLNCEFPIEKATHPDFIFDKFTTVWTEESDLQSFYQEFSKDFIIIPHFGDVCELVPKKYSKATGIQTIIDYLGVSLSDCYAFGDSINDLEMLKYVSHSIGMGNSVDEVLKVVEYCTDDILKDGIKKALIHYGLI